MLVSKYLAIAFIELIKTAVFGFNVIIGPLALTRQSTLQQLLAIQTSTLTQTLNELDNRRNITCGSNYLTVNQDAFQCTLEMLSHNCKGNIQTFQASRLQLSMKDYYEHDLIYHNSFLIESYNIISSRRNVLVGILTYGSCENFFVQRLRDIYTSNSKQVFCYALRDDEKLPSAIAGPTIIDNFRDMNFLVLALSHIDTLTWLEYCASLHSYKAKILTFGFSKLQADMLQKKYNGMRLENIQMKKEENSIDQTSVDVTLLKNFFNQSHTSYGDYQRSNNLIMESLHSNASSRLHNQSVVILSPLLYQKKVFVNSTSRISYPFIYALDNIRFDKDGNCGMGKKCHIPHVASGTTTWTTTCCTGISVELMELVADEVGFVYDIYIVEDGAYGGLNNGIWNGMVGQLAYNHSDVAVQALTVTESRLKAVDFSPGYIITNLGMVTRVKMQDLELINWEFLHHLEFGLMIAVLVSTIVLVILVYFIENSSYYLRGFGYFPFREAMTYVVGLTFQRDMGGKNPLKWSGRILALGYAVAMTMVMSTYTAYITADSIQVQDDSFNGLRDLLSKQNGDFKIATVPDTSVSAFFKNNPTKVYQEVWKNMVSVRNGATGVRKVYDGEIDVFVDETIYVQRTIGKNKDYCKKTKIHAENGRQFALSFAMKKGFALTPEISSSVQKLIEEGVVDELIAKWFYIPNCKTYELEDHRFSWKYFGGIIVGMGLFVGANVVINLAENFYTYLKHQKGYCGKRIGFT